LLREPADRTSSRPAVGVVGLGYMGLATAASFAQHDVVTYGYDVVPERRAAVRSGTAPFYEEGLGELVGSATRSGRLAVVDTLADLANRANVIFLCLPTPPLASGRIDLRPLEQCARALGRVLRDIEDFRLVVVKSTVVPGTTEGVLGPLLAKTSGKGPARLAVASSPEFLAEGRMVADALHPDRVVVGVSDRRSAGLLQDVYATFDSPVIVVTPSGAEMTKYAANSFLALKVSFANEVSRFSERVGVDIDDVVRGFGSDPRIGPRFLQAGPGFGGSCFSKDVRAFVRSARDHGVRLRLAEQVIPVNDDQTRHATELVVNALPDGPGGSVAVLGLAFKEGTDDLRESRALEIIRELTRREVDVRAHDPAALVGFRRWLADEPGSVRSRVTVHPTALDAVTGADVAVLQSAWSEYLAWPDAWTGRMRHPVVVDLRRAFSPKRAAAARLHLIRLGDGASLQGSAAASTPVRRRSPTDPRARHRATMARTGTRRSSD
jgi:UDPglucose 6-dehydrogenase